ncbi:thiol peroxidase [Peribacillus muralis]|uniref:thiol peroxidase n=1 Tax=Peribacillus muralis TaxID=264697 RepID=UPI001F4E1357|nr:thiol peroxidase [Peribacillus muralis]MCK1993938.1 thiol peroxidase [Peribacillus muralis]MCK2014493.1 thiol peroxidase [Peribacillus muralis]
MSEERSSIVTFGGESVTLIGTEIRVGDKAPNFEVLANDLSKVTLEDSKGKVRLISCVPSLDTGVCDAQTREFNEVASSLGNDVEVLTISVDLPFAQKRWCGAVGIEQTKTLSDHFKMSFGTAYGTYIKEHRLECRAVFVVDEKDVVQYVEYVPEITEHPNYEAAIKAIQSLLKVKK